MGDSPDWATPTFGMPWNQTAPMTERSRFVALHQEGCYSMTELCDRFGISRKTGYKWLGRFAETGLSGLADQSRAPHACPHRTPKSIETALVRAREAHPHWGPKKLVAYLARKQPELALPAISTAGDILDRHGLVKARPRRAKPVHPGNTSLKVDAPNQVWIADFKGQFLTGNGEWCYPLTVTDAHSRFLLACQALPSTQSAGAQPVFSRLFAEYGLPVAMRTDNGTPFASTALAGLSRLNLYWIKLGIRHQRIDPGHPEQNGRHERMHKTLKAETTRPPQYNLSLQQGRFADFQLEYNEERPHEALAQEPPRSHYTASERPLPLRAPAPEYPGHLLTRRVSSGGTISFGAKPLFLTEVLAGERIGLEEIADGLWSLYFYDVLVGRFNERDWRIYA